ncbi:unnamed protein product [Soboliphyme baturini]|uniref:Rep_fac-A_C domain-containing protein n=1 Tax=Soboliphyme baturini TaxID=241478 RepID=A0A183IWN3_9BILA|nr:unnamed protein product [Soboliphyme baturini]
MNPDIKEAHRLRGWYDSEAKPETIKNLSVASAGGGFTLLAQAETERLGSGDKADYFGVKAMVIGVKRDSCLYQACPTADCKKKVYDENNGMYRCEKCNKHYPNFKWRMLLSVITRLGTHMRFYFVAVGDNVRRLRYLKSRTDYVETLPQPIFGFSLVFNGPLTR